MTLPDRIQQTRAVCCDALRSSPLAEAGAYLVRSGLTPEACSQLLRRGARLQQPAPELTALHGSMKAENLLPDFAFERALLVRTALATLDQILTLAVDESVKHLFCREFQLYANPPARTLEDFALGGRHFAAMSGVVCCSRFPAGQYHWIVSGFPRSWFAKVTPARLPAFCGFLFTKAHGRAPFFEPHLNGTTARSSFVTEREYLKSFYRMALAIEKQPSIKGIMAVSWLYSRETHRVSPHLAFFNQPYTEVGGFYVDLGAADPKSGFLERDPKRTELYRSGEYKPTNALVLCSRAQAIAWRQAHPEFEAMLAVR